MGEIATVTGTTRPSALGRTLMHEHLMIGYPGWESHSTAPGAARDEMLAVCVDRVEELKDAGFTTLLDPCPNDLGRDVEFMAEVSARTGFQIICATGLYKQDEGGFPYWNFRGQFEDVTGAMAELFERELREGVGASGVRAGIIKVGTGRGQMTAYEEQVFRAAAQAARATGAPITTHTDDGTLGDVQQRVLTEAGVSASRIIIGHSCGTADGAYHLRIARGGSYLGFDRFGLELLQPDAERVRALVALIEAGAGDRVVVSHDSVWCWRGTPVPNPQIAAELAPDWQPLHFSTNIAPKLRAAGVSEAQLDALLVENPRRFFAGEALPKL